jgi:hypothetical protein
LPPAALALRNSEFELEKFPLSIAAVVFLISESETLKLPSALSDPAGESIPGAKSTPP